MKTRTKTGKVTKTLGLGVLSEIESAGCLLWDGIVGGAHFFQRDGFIVTRRGLLSYLKSLRLNLDQLSGKTVLDLGCGKSRFTELVNEIQQDTGTHAIALDRFAHPPNAGEQPFVRADAFALPFADNSIELSVSNWFFNLWLPDWTNWGLEKKKDNINGLLNELIRVGKPGGEIRLAYAFANAGMGGPRYVCDQAKANPKVVSVEKHAPSPFSGCIVIHLAESKEDRQPE